MYDFIYGFFYKYFTVRSDDDARNSAIYGVMLAYFTHGFFLLVCFKELTRINIATVLLGHEPGKYIGLIVILPIMYLIHRMYDKRSERIISKYQNTNLINIQYTLLVLLIILAPLVLGIQLLNH
jgi:hypothetical protein